MSTSFTWFGWCSASQIFLFLMQDQESRQTAHQHGSPSTPVLMSSAIETDPWYCVADEVRKAGQSCIHTWPVCVSTAQSETHHPSLYPGPIYHLADEGPTWISLNRWYKCTQTHHWEVSKCSKGTSYKPNIQCRFVSTTVISTWQESLPPSWYPAQIMSYRMSTCSFGSIRYISWHELWEMIGTSTSCKVPIPDRGTEDHMRTEDEEQKGKLNKCYLFLLRI